METTTWLFFIFNCLVAVWIIAHPILLSGKLASPGKRIILVALGVVYGVIVLTAITQIEGRGSRTSPYNAAVDVHAGELITQR